MYISLDEYRRRYAAIRELMKKDGLDCLLVVGLPDDFNHGNIRYITGAGRGGCCIFPLEGTPVFLVGQYQSTSPKLDKTLEAHSLLELKETGSPTEQAPKELARFYKGNRVGVVGMGCISVALYTAVKEQVKGKLVDSMWIFEQLRSVKSAEEVELVRKSAAVADDVCALLRKIIKPGISDFEVYGQVKELIYREGCDYSFDLIDASGGKMNMTYWPTGDKLKANSTLFMEITPAYGGYYGQLPVTLPIGKYPPVVKKMIGVWAQANREALSILRPGIRMSDIYKVMMEVVRQSGFVSPLRPGHSLGLDVLDFWSITESNQMLAKPGMVVAIHPCIMTEMWGFGSGMGYTYLITETGTERFSKIELAEIE